MVFISQTYEKAIKVIDSCENEEQLKGASNYVTLFKDYFEKLGSDNQLIEIYYSELKSKILSKLDES
ncbi:hypothetical protein N9H34_02080 [bacterium]|nr:hypothetical protein [bacterium]